MDIQSRINEVTQKFDQQKVNLEQSEAQTAEIKAEMARLQGEYRLLEELQASEKPLEPSVNVKDEAKVKEKING